MECEKFLEQISLYIDGELDEDSKQQFEKHINVCQECRKEYYNTLKTVDLCKNLDEVEPPGKLSKNIMNAVIQENKKNKGLLYFNIKKRWKVFTGIAAVILLMFVVTINTLLTPLGSSFKGGIKGEFQMADFQQEAVSQEEVLESKRNISDYDFKGPAEESHPQSTAVQNISRKIIKKAQLNITVEDFDGAYEQIIVLTKETGGYIEDSRITKDKTGKMGHVAARVPRSHFEEFIMKVENLGEVTNKAITGNDITTQYFDTQARVNNFKKQEQRLLEILEKAKTVEEILKIENELNRIRYEIERLTGQLKQWDNLVELSTVNIYLRQTQTPQKKIKPLSFKDIYKQAVEAFIRTVNNILIFTGKMIVFFGGAIPIIVVLVIPLLVVFLVLKRRGLG